MPEAPAAPGVTIVHDRPTAARPIGNDRRSAVVSGDDFVKMVKEPPPGEGTARKSLHDNLSRRAGQPPAATPPPEIAPVDEAGEPPEGGDAPPDETVERPGAEPETSAEEPEQPPAPEPEKGKVGKKNNWKAMEESLKSERGKVATLEKQLSEVRQQLTPEADRKVLQGQIEELQKTVKTYEDEIRFSNFEKHPDFVRDYNAPYEGAWSAAMEELGELTVDDGTGGRRQVTALDVQKLTNVGLEEAKRLATEIFGDFAPEAMAHRKSILEVFKKRKTALDEAKTKGAERQKQKFDAQSAQVATLQKEITGLYQDLTNTAMSDLVGGKYLKPITPGEGKELTPDEKEWNTALEEGERFTSEGWAKSPLEPGISAEERKLRVKRHVAIFQRSRAFKAVRLKAERLQKQLDEAKKSLSEYEKSIPPTNGRRGGSAPSAPLNARQSFRDALKKRAAK